MIRNYFFMIFLFLLGCHHPTPSVEELYKADRDFSALSEKTGFANAFVEYAHEDAVLLRPSRMPVVGRDEIVKLYERAKSSPVILTWEPLSGDISSAGDMGYTYGTYKVISGQDTTSGTYVSIWKKDREGLWKYVLDTGNEGL